MKILVCHNHYQQRGGEDVSFEAEAQLLESRGHTVLRYTLHNDAIAAMGSVDVTMRTLWNPAAYRAVIDLIDAHAPDLVHCHNTFPLMSPAILHAARARRVPVIQTLRNYRLLCANALLLRDGKPCNDCVGSALPWRGAMHGCYRGSRAASAVTAGMIGLHRTIGTWRNAVDHYIALSRFARDRFVAGGIPVGRISVKPNFVDITPIADAPRKHEAVFVGRLSQEKGVDVLLDAWRRLDAPLTLRIVGDGPLADRVRAAAADDTRIVFEGRLPVEAVHERIAAARCVVVPSICYETFGRTVIEAFSRGTPVIVSNHGAPAELVDDDVTGLHFQPGDAADLAAKVARAARDDAWTAAAGAAALQAWRQRYTAEANYRQLMNIYRRVLTRAAPAKPKCNLLVKPLRHLPRFRAARRAMDVLADRETWSRSDIEAFQLGRLNAVWAHAVKHVPYYSRFHLPQRFASLDEYTAVMPILEKDDVRRHHADLLSRDARHGRWFRTGGSTGTPVAFYWDRAAYREILQCRYRLLDSWGVDAFDRTAFLWGHDSHAAGAAVRCKQRITDAMRNRIRLSAYDLDRDALRAALRRMRAFQPAMLYGFANAIHLLAREAKAADFDCPSLKLAVLTAEPVHPGIAQEVEEALRAPAVIEYGASECGAIAMEAPDRTLRVREDVAFVETIEQPTGGCDVVLTVLNNPHFPLLRYRIGDMTDHPLEKPDEGFAIMSNVAGRTDDLIVTRSGKCVHPTLIEAVFEAHPHCRAYRVHQQADGSLDVRFVPADASARVNVAELRQQLMMLMLGASVTVRVTDEITLSAGGKHRILTSDVTNAASAVRGSSHATANRPAAGDLPASTRNP